MMLEWRTPGGEGEVLEEKGFFISILFCCKEKTILRNLSCQVLYYYVSPICKSLKHSRHVMSLPMLLIIMANIMRCGRTEAQTA